MIVTRQTQVAALRAIAMLFTVGIAWWATGFTGEGAILRPVLVGYAVFLVTGSVLAARRYAHPPVPLLLLLGDLIAIGAVGCWLHEGLEPQAAFLAGYTIALLVAAVGRSLISAVLGSLAGAMTMGLAVTLFATLKHVSPDLWQVTLQVALLGCGAGLTARITGWLEVDARTRQLAERVETAVREHEAHAAQLVTFAQSLAESTRLHDLADATVRHLRCHLNIRARAVALTSLGEAVAVWEESGRLTDDNVERRRSLLQESLSRVGNDVLLPPLDAHSTGGRTLPTTLDFRTVVEIPIRASGRVAGVLWLGDARRGALPEDRISVVADVARRVGQAVLRIERQSIHEHQRTALLLQQMRDGVMLLGPDGRVLLSNPAARDALGCPGSRSPFPEHIGEHSLVELAETPAGVSRKFRVRLESDEDLPPVQLSCVAAGVVDGSRQRHTLVTLSDVTEEEKARSRLVLSEKLSLVGQTLAGVAHELNNPLTALIGYADLLSAQEIPPRLEKTLTKIQEQATRATRIVKNLLSVARQRNPERKVTDITQVVNSVVELFAYEARVSSVKLEVEYPPDLPSVLGDPHALQQVFVNLIQNAIHAVKDQAGERRIHVAILGHPDSIHIAVADSGPGIPADLRARIFQAFFTTKGPEKGTGLGLALSRSIARDHGGDLILDDGPEGGARFVMRLPRTLRESHVASTSSIPGLTLGLKVLLVDDEKVVREAVVAQLGRIGCQVTSTETAVEATRLIDLGNFDAILTDVRMPGTNGIELYDLVAGKDAAKAARLIFMTGDTTNEDLLRAVKNTGRPLLEKPFTLDELVQLLRESTRATTPPAAAVAAKTGEAPKTSRADLDPEVDVDADAPAPASDPDVSDHVDADEALGRILSP